MGKLQDRLTQTRAAIASQADELAQSQARVRAFEAVQTGSESSLQRLRIALDQQTEINTGKTAEIARLKMESEALMSETERSQQREKNIDNNTRATACTSSLDLEEKQVQIKALEEQLYAKNKIIDEADKQSQQLQEKLCILEARQDAIKGVIQKREMEYLKAATAAGLDNKEIDRLNGELKKMQK